MAPLKLKKLLQQAELAAILAALTQGQAWGVADAQHQRLAGTFTGGEGIALTSAGQTIGWVYGAMAPVLARWLQYLIVQEEDKRALAQETLDRYREINLLYDLAEKMHATLDLQALADLVMAETQ
ncbi:MAG: hypothetical protein Q6K18_02035, partial [Gloeomargarita sp. DG_1_5_bins_55]